MVFAPGPIFANIVLADEINRTPPKTQSALLEAMQEHRVTIQGRTYKLEEPFYVFATQNPIELEGTYPLPEAQLDRFMFHIVIDHPPEDEELDVVRDDDGASSDPHVRAAGDRRRPDRVPAARAPRAGGRSRSCATRSTLVRTSRPKATDAPESVKKWVAFGASVRAAQYLVLGAQGARAHERALPRELRRHPRDGAPGAAPPRADQLPRRVGGHDDRHPIVDQLLEAVAGCRGSGM